MAREWTKAELDFLTKHLKKGEPIHKIADSFNEEFDRRTYDSIQKKTRRLREDGLEYKLKTEEKKNQLSEQQTSVLTKYVSVLGTLGRKPSLAELEEEGVGRFEIKESWGDLKKLELAARVEHKELFKEVELSSLLTPQARVKITDMISKTKRFVVTTAITGCRVDENFLDAIDHYCKVNDAELIVMVASDPAHQYVSDDKLGVVDEILEPRFLVAQDTELNNNLFLSAIQLEAKAIDPSTGLQDLAQKTNSSYIMGSPKQRLKFVAVPDGHHPPAIIGTGCVTEANYNTDMYRSRRTGYMADKLHVMGAVIVEIEDEEVFHFRHVQAQPDGSFIDWGVQYGQSWSTPVELEALVCGDEHAGRQDMQVIDARLELAAELQPKRIVLHDLFDGESISHHTEGKSITMAIRAQEMRDSLLDELVFVGEALDRYQDYCDKIIVVKSNHDEHLVKYLQDARFIKDPKNYRLSLDLAAAIFDGKDPIQVGTEIATGKSYAHVVWLRRDQEYVVAGVDLSHHGDRGPNGSRGGIKAIARSIRASITGHSHTSEIYGSAFRVGTSTPKLDYCVGPSSWTNTDCLLYGDGSRQLVHYIRGRCKVKD